MDFFVFGILFPNLLYIPNKYVTHISNTQKAMKHSFLSDKKSQRKVVRQKKDSL